MPVNRRRCKLSPAGSMPTQIVLIDNMKWDGPRRAPCPFPRRVDARIFCVLASLAGLSWRLIRAFRTAHGPSNAKAAYFAARAFEIVSGKTRGINSAPTKELNRG